MIILVVEDDVTIALLLGELLVEMGHGVCAIEGTEAGAIAAAAKHDPDMMIVDAMLGDESGVTAVEAIIRCKRVPQVFVSGNIAAVFKALPNAVGLKKPYTELDLALAMQRALEA